MFYFLFQSRSDSANDPVVLWMTGGPGCSSELAVFYEQGPYKINKDMTLTETEWGWDKFHTMIFVDQPINTGFSYSTDAEDRVYDEETVGNDMLDFIYELFSAHPELAGRPFFVTGESYAGHYVPAVSHRIWLANKNKEGPHINLEGIAIGNGLTEPSVQFPAYADFAAETGLISSTYRDFIHVFAPLCTFATGLCNDGWSVACALGLPLCEMTQFSPIMAWHPTMNVYDITKSCDGTLCYDFTLADRFLNLKSTQQALGVNKEWVGCDGGVYEDMSMDWLKKFDSHVADMLNDGIRVMIYAGELDFICNWLGNKVWVDAMEWKGKAEFSKATEKEWTVLGVHAGTEKTYGGLSFVKVAKAGHMVPMDQPFSSLQMITAFTRGRSVVSHSNEKGVDPVTVSAE